jgi:thioredoxin 1
MGHFQRSVNLFHLKDNFHSVFDFYSNSGDEEWERQVYMAVVEMTSSNIEDTINNNKIVVIDFWAPWCGPCKQFGPIFEESSTKNPDIVHAKVNTDVEQEIAGSFEIKSIPTVAIFKEQTLIFQEAGSLPEEALEQILAQVKTLDMAQIREEIRKAELEQGKGDKT